MFNIIRVSVFLVVLLPFSSVSAQGSFDCDLLVGTWVGEHSYENGQTDRWKAVYSEDRVFSIEFFGKQSDEPLGSQIGSWECDGLWVTSTTSDNGVESRFRYQIKVLDSDKYLYESSQGPLFTSYRQQEG